MGRCIKKAERSLWRGRAPSGRPRAAAGASLVPEGREGGGEREGDRKIDMEVERDRERYGESKGERERDRERER